LYSTVVVCSVICEVVELVLSLHMLPQISVHCVCRN